MKWKHHLIRSSHMVDLISLLQQIDPSILALAIIILLTLEVFMLSFPKEVVLIFAGVTFGTVIGTWINLAGLFLAAVLGFEAGKTGRWYSEEKLQRHLRSKYVQMVNNRGVLALFILRIFPLTPNDILSIACGYLRLRRIPYYTITFITAIPYALLWAYLGSEQLEFIKTSYEQNFNPMTWLITFIFIVLFAGLIVSKMTTKKELMMD